MMAPTLSREFHSLKHMYPLAHIGFRKFQPAPALRGLVQCYWHILVLEPHRHGNLKPEFMHPEGGSGIIFNFGDPILIDGQQIANSPTITGPTRQTNQLEMTGFVDTLGIRFHPGGAYGLLSTPLSELLDHLVNPIDLGLKTLGSSFADQLASEQTVENRVGLLDKALSKLLKEDTIVDQRLGTALAWFKQSKGQQPISRLTESLNLSQRQLDRHFKKHLGLLPKQFSHIKQVDYARHLLKQSPATQNLTDIGFLAGFYDQAHFIKKFKKIIGITPGEYQSKLVL